MRHAPDGDHAARVDGDHAVQPDDAPASEHSRTLINDLSRLGVTHRHPDQTEPAPTGDGATLIPEQRALLRRLANGETIAAAAAAEFLSLRTANRRIAQARAVFGVRTTREAVLAYLRQRPSR